MSRELLRSLSEHNKMRNSNDRKGKRQVVEMNVKGQDKRGEKSTSYCIICMTTKPTSAMFKGCSCRNRVCTNCISKHVAAKIQRNILNVKCPFFNCDVSFKPENVRSILPKEVLDRWQNAVFESKIPATQKFYCPFKDCSALLILDNKAKQVVTSSQCPYCHRLFCARCMASWHVKLTCEEFQKLKGKENDDLDRKLQELAKMKNWQRCSKYFIYVDRISGCEHITCRCGHNFCYMCGSQWAHGHVCKRT